MDYLADLRQTVQWYTPEARSMELVAYALLKPGLWATGWYRLARAVRVARIPLLPEIIGALSSILTASEISTQATIGEGLTVFHPAGIVIHGDVVIGRRLRLHSGVVIGYRGRGKAGGVPQIGDDVLIGANASILGEITIGDGARIGANALVIDDVPAGCVAAGVPAKSWQPRVDQDSSRVGQSDSGAGSDWSR